MSKEVLKKRNDGSVELQRVACGVLPLVLKGEWFDMIDTGAKKVEFRRADYWLPRASKWVAKCQRENLLPVIEFRHGYRPDARRMAFVCGYYLFKNYGLVRSLEPFVFRLKGTPVLFPELGETDIDRVVFHLGERVRLTECKC